MGSYTVSVSIDENPDYLTITSTGSLPFYNVSGTITAKVLKSNPFLFAMSSMDINDPMDISGLPNTVLVDSYNSSEGAYGGVNVLKNGDIFSNDGFNNRKCHY